MVAHGSGVKWIWSRAASLIAVVAIVFDAAMHYILPSNIAIQEGIPYFVVKYIVVEISAAVILAVKAPPSWRAWKPFLIGFVGSSAFGTVYYVFPWISSEPGYLTLPYRLLWGVFHALVIWMAAAIILRKPRQVGLAVLLLVTAVGVGLFVPLALY